MLNLLHFVHVVNWVEVFVLRVSGLLQVNRFQMLDDFKPVLFLNLLLFTNRPEWQHITLFFLGFTELQEHLFVYVV